MVVSVAETLGEIPAGKERGERKRTADDVSKAD
jgi:hypothetical protein